MNIFDKSGKLLKIVAGASLRYAELRYAELREADLRYADLSGAHLNGADLHGADLREANLSGAYLHGADLSGADLSCADLHGAYLHGADLREANLCEADLRHVDLREANLSGADLSYAYLHGADLRHAKNVPYLPETIIVPEGDLIVYKKVFCARALDPDDPGIAVLLIPKHAERSNATTRKCRASEAIVLECPEGATSIHNKNFKYVVGETVKPEKPFDKDRWNECASGIHFFLTRKEAEDYV